MSVSLDPSLRVLTGCGCCEGVAVTTPVRIYNRPGLNAIAYRVGTHALFKQSLLARLSSARYLALHGLTTRQNDDFTVGLLDAWSTAADVLSFYQERIANEAFLRTATERFSVLEMGRLIGYRLDPGVAASVYLAFEIESAPGAFGQALAAGNQVQAQPQTPPLITIGSGVKVQSIPGPDEAPQTFETVAPIEAQAEHNAIPPRLEQPQVLSRESPYAFVKETTLNLHKGDLIMISDTGGVQARPVLNVSLDNDRNVTRLDFTEPPAGLSPFARPTDPVTTLDEFLSGLEADPEKGTVSLDAVIVQRIAQARWTIEDLNSLIQLQNWDRAQLIRNMRQQANQPDSSGELRVFRKRAKVFGFNAPLQVDYNPNGTPKLPPDWVEWEPGDDEDAKKLFLAEADANILPGSYVAIDHGTGEPKVYRIQSVLVRPRTAYGVSSESTELMLYDDWWDPSAKDFNPIRSSTVYVESEQLELAPVPIEDQIKTETIESEEAGKTTTVTAVTLDQAYLDLKTGQTVILTGKRTDLEGITATEVLTVRRASLERGFTVFEFNEELAATYQRDSVRIQANVAPATHGETVEEILGSGNAGQPFQRFTLKQPPLTYVSAATPSGSQSTFEVRVNDILWKEVPSFYGRGPGERIYMTQLDDDGNTTVIFGDGIQGARLPTGRANVKAKYRKGLGLGGLVRAGQLSQLMTRPLGVKAAVNPLPAEGAEDPDVLEHARRNAPVTVLTLGRIVSLKDFEDFARSFAGIDKALATSVGQGESRAVFLTVAGPNGAAITEGGSTHTKLLNAITARGDSNVFVTIRSFRQRLFRVKGKVKLKSDRLVAAVQPQIEQRLREHFSFDARDFGQPVALSEIVAVIHENDAVQWVDIDALYRSDEESEEEEEDAIQPSVLPAAFPRPGAAELLRAELLTLDPAPLELEVTL